MIVFCLVSVRSARASSSGPVKGSSLRASRAVLTQPCLHLRSARRLLAPGLYRRLDLGGSQLVARREVPHLQLWREHLQARPFAEWRRQAAKIDDPRRLRLQQRQRHLSQRRKTRLLSHRSPQRGFPGLSRRCRWQPHPTDDRRFAQLLPRLVAGQQDARLRGPAQR